MGKHKQHKTKPGSSPSKRGFSQATSPAPSEPGRTTKAKENENTGTRKKQKTEAKKALKTRQFKIFGFILLLVLITALVFYIQVFQPRSSSDPATTKTNQQIGEVSCKDTPEFITNLQFDPANSSLTTDIAGVKGLELIEGSQNQPTRTYNDPSWQMAGNLGPIIFGKDGNVFVAPIPVINVLDNPVAKQTEIYKVDHLTGKMSSFVDLPKAGMPNDQNPFGVLGLDYDCETNSLYASSVANSKRTQEIGRLYQIDGATSQLKSEYDNIDAMGVGVFNGTHGKRLYYGLARLPEIWSIGLDSKGKFVGQPRLEISLATIGINGHNKARRISFTSDNGMDIYGVEFSFNLIAPTEKQETIYHFNYDLEDDKWVFSPSNAS